MGNPLNGFYHPRYFSLLIFFQVEIPQHPVDLHSIVTRGTKELSSTLQEFRGVRILQRGSKAHATEEQVD